MDRPTSRDDRPHSPASAHTNVFDDEFEVETPADDTHSIVVDGFTPQPASEEPTAHTANNDVPEGHDQVFAKHNSTESAETPFQLPSIRSSIAKGGNFKDGPVHGPNGSEGQSAYGSQSPMHRASVASTNSFVTNGRSSTPMAGPSHPYTMYPQGTGLVRSPSNTTASTLRQPQRSFSGQRPTHPYGMYPQNVLEDEEPTAHEYGQQSLPLGFPGHANGYTRQIGPDGEEQDIIGPDGHTEQLPPYSKYPDESPKALIPPAPTTVSTPVSPPPQNRVPSPVEPPLPLDFYSTAANNAVPMQDRSPSLPNARASVRSATHSAMSSSPGSEQSGRKTWNQKTWTEKRKTRVCGRIPLWLLILMAGLVIIFAIILGAAIGSIFTKAKKAEEQADRAPQVTVTTTATLYDASIIPTPSDMLPLPTGAYSIQMGQPQDRNPGCLPQIDQQNAWSCDFRGPQDLQLGVRNNPSMTSGLSMGQLSPPPNGNTTISPAYQYGMQPPMIDWRTMDLVRDHDQPTWGPAYHFQAQYNKLVILEEDNFPAGMSVASRKRGYRGPPPNEGSDGGPFPRHQLTLVEGDKPWFCWWNATFIEVYLYADQYSYAGNMSMGSMSQTVSQALSTPAPTSPTPVTSQQQIKREPYPAAATPTPVVYKRGNYFGQDSVDPLFPRIVKIEERRIPGSPSPVCTQMLKLEDGSIVPANNDYSPIIVNLNEEDPTMADFAAADTGNPYKRKIGSRGDPADGCHCQWVAT